ncbi:MAG: hypothetical protein P4L64_06840, partial [Caulobacteraceae bacterium]|nr:hypothetical protein [Caulobacteraceae bacterium]
TASPILHSPRRSLASQIGFQMIITSGFVRAVAAASFGLVATGQVMAQGVDPTARGVAAAAFARVPNTVTPMVGSTAAAANNSAMINAALSAGGTVNVQCSGVAYVSTHLTLNTNNTLTGSSGCTLRQVAGNNDGMIYNAAAQTSWTTTQKNTSGAVGPFSLIWNQSAPAWATGVAQTGGSTATTPIYVTSNGAIYWLTNTSTCTTGATAPTGIGTGISDGGCTWSYVTTNQFGSVSPITYSNVTVYYPNHGLSVGSAIVLTPQGSASYTLPAAYFWSGAGSAGAQNGPIDPAFMGIFPVVGVNDANWVTVQLRQQPTGIPTSIPMLVKAADQNITCCGDLVFDYNSPANTGAGVGKNTMLATFAGVQNLRVTGLRGLNVQKYVMYLNGVSVADVGFITSNSTPSDLVKVYGPAADVNIHDVSGSAGDDIVSLQAEDYPTQWPNSPNYMYETGNIVNVAIRRVTSMGGFAVKLYATHSILTMDDIKLEDINTEQQRGGDYSSADPTIIFYGTGITSHVGTVSIRGGGVHLAATPYIATFNSTVGGNAGPTIDHLIIDQVGGGLNWPTLVNTAAVGNILSIGSGYFTFNDIDIEHVSALIGPGNLEPAVALFSPTNTIKHITLGHSYIGGLIPNAGYAVYIETNGPVVGLVSIHDNTFLNIAYGARIYTATTLDFDGNYFSGTSNNIGLGLGVSGITAKFRGNYFSPGYVLGAVRNGGAYTGTISFDGTNTFASGAVIETDSGTKPTLINAVEIAANGTPTVSSCGSGSAITGNNLAGQIVIPAGVTACAYAFTTNAFPAAPRGVVATQTGSTPAATNATATTSTLTIYSAGGVTVNYQVTP